MKLPTPAVDRGWPAMKRREPARKAVESVGRHGPRQRRYTKKCDVTATFFKVLLGCLPPLCGHRGRRSRSLSRMSENTSVGDAHSETPDRDNRRFGIDGVSRFMGMRWDDPNTVRLQIRPELINAGGLLSGVATYALVDYCMGSTLWAQTSDEERIATINIAINYVQTATEGEIVCTTTLDRRNRSNAVLSSEVRHEDGRLLVTAIGSYTIFSRKRAPQR